MFARLVSDDRHATIVPLEVYGEGEAEDVIAAVARADADPAFAVSVTGTETLDHDFNLLSQEDLENGELKFGLPAALIVLLLVFGAVVAGLVPLLMAMVGIVLISSELPEVLALAHRIVVMHEGRVTGILTHDKATEEILMAYATGIQDDYTEQKPA